MNKMITFLTMVLLLTASGAALAATNPEPATMSNCQGLMKQFDDALSTHSTAPRIVTAKSLRTEAQKACDSGQYHKGVSDLRAALRDIGVKPVSEKTAKN